MSGMERGDAARDRVIAWPDRQHLSIVPIFLPFFGCPGRCIFCSQQIQTGVTLAGNESALDLLLARMRQEVETRLAVSGTAPEVAFYGGTFTALPDWAWRHCLAWADGLRNAGVAATFRCSTRPDCLEAGRLADLRASGFHLVELGIQSFDDAALAKCGRGYDGRQALLALDTLRAAGLEAGVQLMPGMPGVTEDIFLADTCKALESAPACLRFYPCLALAGTELARMWQSGDFMPWTLEQAIDALARAWQYAARVNVPVIRMGLAPQPGLDKSILAGPVHPALGSRVMGRALLEAVRGQVGDAGGKLQEIWLPRRAQGYMWGWHSELREDWRKLGVTGEITRFWPQNIIRIVQS